jgi:hypothetical protein
MENSMSKPTWNDINNERPSDLMKHYKLDEKAMGKVVRDHSNDIKCPVERRGFYEKVYNNRGKR